MSKFRTLLVEAWRVTRRRIVRPTYRKTIFWCAVLYRRALLRRVIFIGVAGSCGKTTTKELIAAILSSQFKGNKNDGNMNLPSNIIETIFRVRPGDKFCVQEIAAAVRGDRIPLAEPLRLVKPQIGVVTNIGADHLSAFGTLEAIAAEKGKLIEALPRHGTAILNADDANVLAMRAKCAGRVITYGLAPDAMVRAEDVRCSWPERLSFTVLYDGQSHAVQTQLCGTHWLPCVLTALATGLAMGVPLGAAVQVIRAVPPFEGRMSPVSHQDGITFIRDTVKTPLWSIPPALKFMKEAKAKRKIIVVGTISDYTGNSDRQYVSVARQALATADHVVFVGSRASKCLKAKRYPQDTALQAFYSTEAAADHMRDLLQPGDLVLLKGSGRDRLGKLTLARMMGEAGLQDTATATPMAPPFQESRANRPVGLLPHVSATPTEFPVQAVVGLGNIGSEYRDTPHNVGQRVPDLLASSLGGRWTQLDQAMVAGIGWQGEHVYLVKPLTFINDSGPLLSKLGHRLGFGPAECILVHDDIDLPLGTVRLRMRGSDGGHRGVRSILQAFRTDAIRRVKIGVGRPERQDQVTGHVLAAFSPTELLAVETACTQAADRALELVASWRARDCQLSSTEHSLSSSRVSAGR